MRAVVHGTPVRTAIRGKFRSRWGWRAAIATAKHKLSLECITVDGFGITEAGMRYLRPLVAGEVPSPCRDDLPDFVFLDCKGGEKCPPATKS